MNLVDTHSHIYLADFDADREQMLQRAVEEGVRKVVMPAIDSTTHEKMLAMEDLFPGHCFSMMGLHPCSVKQDYHEELNIVKGNFEKRTFRAVGETGLDFYWDLSFKKEQSRVFQEQIELALHYDIPVVIHSRESIDECIQTIGQHQSGKLKGIFHCFSGTAEQATKIIELGFFLGIGGVVTFKNAGLDKVLKSISLDNIVLETDAPYLAPVPFRGKRNECSYLKFVVDKLAEIKNSDIEEIARVTTVNAEKLFRL